MNIEQQLMQRSDSKCELCGAADQLAVYAVTPYDDSDADRCILCCATCRQQLADSSVLEASRWRSLNDTVWSPVAAVQVVSCRLLQRLTDEPWAQDLLATVYLEDEVREWLAAGNTQSHDDTVPTVDCHGAQLQAGDTVTLIKDLDVKGANFTAKRGTAVRNISLTNNPEHIEGRVNGTRIVILTQFVKRSS